MGRGGQKSAKKVTYYLNGINNKIITRPRPTVLAKGKERHGYLSDQ